MCQSKRSQTRRPGHVQVMMSFHYLCKIRKKEALFGGLLINANVRIRKEASKKVHNELRVLCKWDSNSSRENSSFKTWCGITNPNSWSCFPFRQFSFRHLQNVCVISKNQPCCWLDLSSLDSSGVKMSACACHPSNATWPRFVSTNTQQCNNT